MNQAESDALKRYLVRFATELYLGHGLTHDEWFEQHRGEFQVRLLSPGCLLVLSPNDDGRWHLSYSRADSMRLRVHILGDSFEDASTVFERMATVLNAALPWLDGLDIDDSAQALMLAPYQDQICTSSEIRSFEYALLEHLCVPSTHIEMLMTRVDADSS